MDFDVHDCHDEPPEAQHDTYALQPEVVPGLRGHRVVHIAAGYSHCGLVTGMPLLDACALHTCCD
jgi:hypothetical protein